MVFIIEKMEEKHRKAVTDMMREFYHSSAVLSDGSEEIYKANVDACVTGSPYLEGYVFCADDEIIGYGMLARSFSTEFGRKCVWIEDIYLKEGYRGKGFGSRFISEVKRLNGGCIIRLEAESDNNAAVHTYCKNGFSELPYLEMISHPGDRAFEN